jgi:Uncharacterized protein conserved in bacteria C-term(DUF2220)
MAKKAESYLAAFRQLEDLAAPALTPSERDLYQLLTDPAWTRVRRIEQERIPLGVGAERLYALAAK